ncbi:hypothetical protein X797_008828 [Metarhizium robertsii]|uniref:Uncharacterized protein n=1 Tax=Metarhizium robertsii TaxID=568076 RepID=A0A014MZZ1_9HYPO|nr:hypothetical protein X797_008828 [Metarhizium robertsii]
MKLLLANISLPQYPISGNQSQERTRSRQAHPFRTNTKTLAAMMIKQHPGLGEQSVTPLPSQTSALLIQSPSPPSSPNFSRLELRISSYDTPPHDPVSSTTVTHTSRHIIPPIPDQTQEQLKHIDHPGTPWQTPWRRQPPKRTPQAKLPPEANSTNQVPHVFPFGPPSPQGSRGEPTAGTDVGDYSTATKRTLSAGVLDGVPSQESRTRRVLAPRRLLLLHVRVPVRRATMPRRADESIPEEQVRGACGVPRVFVRCVTGGSVQGGVFCSPLARGGRDDSFSSVPHTLRYKNCEPCNGQARISDDLTTARSMRPPRRIYAHRHDRNTSMSFSERQAPFPLLPPPRAPFITTTWFKRGGVPENEANRAGGNHSTGAVYPLAIAAAALDQRESPHRCSPIRGDLGLRAGKSGKK